MSVVRGPKAFRLDASPGGGEIVMAETPDPYAAEAEAALARTDVETVRRARPGWATLFWSALSSLLSLAAGLWAWSLVESLFAANPMLGYVGAVLAALCLLALAAMGLREFVAVGRLARVARLRLDARAAYDSDDAAAAKSVLAALRGVGRVSAGAEAELARLRGEIIDGRDLLAVAERVLVAPQDRLVRAAIVQAARRVSLVTAISPRAIVDILFVLAQSVRLVRRIADLYGGRPSGVGSLRLARAVLGHLAVTGGIAIGDSLLSQVVGAGLAARLSAKLGEGVLNGVLTARVGLAAIAVCRPLPFLAETPPTLRDLAAPLFESGPDPAKPAGQER